MARAIDADYLMERLNKKKAGPANKRYTEGFNDCLMSCLLYTSDAADE